MKLPKGFNPQPSPDYRAVVMKVISKNVRGIPRQLEIVEDEQTVDIKGGEEFIIAYVLNDIMKGTI